MKDDKPVLRKYVIAFNGPPGCGKDTAVKLMSSYIHNKAPYLAPIRLSFAETLKKTAHALYDVFSSPEYYEQQGLKDTPSNEFMGLSPREAYIDLSENIIKPRFGQDWYGQLAAKRIRRQEHHLMFLVSDCGFVDEMAPIMELVGGRSLLIVELTARRAGVPLDFTGDSRGYIGDQLKQLNKHVTVIRIPNDYSKEKDSDSMTLFNLLLQAAVDKFMGW